MQRLVMMLACIAITANAHAQQPQLTWEPPTQRLPPVDHTPVATPGFTFSPAATVPPAARAPAENLPAPAPQAVAPAEVAAEKPAPAESKPADKATAEPIPAGEKVILEEPGWQIWQPAFWDPWEGSVELGLNGTDGNSETFNVRFGATAKHKTDWLVQTVQVTSIQKNANGVTTANTALLDGRLEWPMPGKRWNFFLHGLTEYDQFKAFDYRLSADTGLGYEWIQNDVTTLMTRSGLSVSQEIGGIDDETKPELLFGGEYKHKFGPTHSISAKVDAYPNITDFSDYRVNSQASWEITLSQIWGLSMKLSVIDRYDSTPQGARPNDVDYSTLLLWNF